MGQITTFQIQDSNGNVLDQKSFSDYGEFEDWAKSYNCWVNGNKIIGKIDKEWKDYEPSN